MSLNQFFTMQMCLNSLEVLYTQDLLPNDLNLDLWTPKYGLWKGEYLNSLSLKMKNDYLTRVIETQTPKGIFIEFPY